MSKQFSVMHGDVSINIKEAVYPPQARSLFGVPKEDQHTLAKRMSEIGNLDFFVSGRHVGHKQYDVSIGYDVSENPTMRVAGYVCDLSQRVQDFFFGPKPPEPPTVRTMRGQTLPAFEAARRPPALQHPPAAQPQAASTSFLGNMVRLVAEFVDWLVSCLCAPFTARR